MQINFNESPSTLEENVWVLNLANSLDSFSLMLSFSQKYF